MTDITREAMKAAWMTGFSDRKIRVECLLAAYEAAFSAFEIQEDALEASFRSLEADLLRVHKAKDELEKYLKRMEEA